MVDNLGVQAQVHSTFIFAVRFRIVLFYYLKYNFQLNPFVVITDSSTAKYPVACLTCEAANLAGVPRELSNRNLSGRIRGQYYSIAVS